MNKMDREQQIYRVTLMGSAVNVVLLIMKFAAGILGHSAAMIADAVHSLSDFLTDIIVIAFVRISGRPEDDDHDYGHGKYETLASALIGLGLLAVGIMILWGGVTDTWRAIQGEQLPQPGMVALIAALASIALKEWAFRFTASVGRKVESQAVVANAWHHRSDALSSIGTSVGIGGAVLLGQEWAVLDPIAAIVVSIFIIVAALKLLYQAMNELMEASLPADLEEEIVTLAEEEPCVSEIHHLRTRRIGSNMAIEMHLRMPGEMTLYHAHEHASNVERRLKQRFGDKVYISLHIEPVKVNGKYCEPTAR